MHLEPVAREQHRRGAMFLDQRRARNAASGAEIGRKVERALAGLGPDRSTAVRLHLQGFTLEEMARLLAWTEPRARNLLYRGLRDLRNALAREGIECEADA